jgi:hypothetical protein
MMRMMLRTMMMLMMMIVSLICYFSGGTMTSDNGDFVRLSSPFLSVRTWFPGTTAIARALFLLSAILASLSLSLSLLRTLLFLSLSPLISSVCQSPRPPRPIIALVLIDLSTSLANTLELRSRFAYEEKSTFRTPQLDHM